MGDVVHGAWHSGTVLPQKLVRLSCWMLVGLFRPHNAVNQSLHLLGRSARSKRTDFDARMHRFSHHRRPLKPSGLLSGLLDCLSDFWTRKAGPKKPLYSCSSCCYQFSKGPKIPKAFLIRSGAQRNFAYTFMLTLPTDLPSQIFHLFSCPALQSVALRCVLLACLWRVAFIRRFRQFISLESSRALSVENGEEKSQ